MERSGGYRAACYIKGEEAESNTDKRENKWWEDKPGGGGEWVARGETSTRLATWVDKARHSVRNDGKVQVGFSVDHGRQTEVGMGTLHSEYNSDPYLEGRLPV
ncbi:Helix-turn-helix domain-containing protein [Sesbania bispinosa]|nr:Helix-turn-helix domain-containing protein [Sesbania bispinosa]